MVVSELSDATRLPGVMVVLSDDEAVDVVDVVEPCVHSSLISALE